MTLDNDTIQNITVPQNIVEAVARHVFNADCPDAHLQAAPVSNRVNGAISQPLLVAGDQCQQVVIKVVDHGLLEADAYRALATGGAPVAELFASYELADGREVLILEYLPRIGIDESVEEFGTFVDMIARFNATADAHLPMTSATWLIDWLSVTRTAWGYARSGRWGEPLVQSAAILDHLWTDIDKLVLAIQQELALLPLDACHQDPLYGNCGWRADGTLVLIDCAYVCRFSALYDLAICLGACNQPWPSTHGREPWIARYCETYNRRSAYQLTRAMAERAVNLQLSASVVWLDERTFHRTDQKLCEAAAAGNTENGWGDWFARTWRRIERMCKEGITGELAG